VTCDEDYSLDHLLPMEKGMAEMLTYRLPQKEVRGNQNACRVQPSRD